MLLRTADFVLREWEQPTVIASPSTIKSNEYKYIAFTASAFYLYCFSYFRYQTSLKRTEKRDPARNHTALGTTEQDDRQLTARRKLQTVSNTALEQISLSAAQNGTVGASEWLEHSNPPSFMTSKAHMVTHFTSKNI